MIPFLSAADAARASRTVRKLARHEVSRWVLTGGFAVEIYRIRKGMPAAVRAWNDLDFLVERFEEIPASLGRDFLFRHVHPLDPAGKTMLQMVDPETSVRVDAFRASPGVLGRARRLISLSDLVARTARLVLDLDAGTAVPAKHARDYLRLIEIADPAEVEAVWPEHRKPTHPAAFHEAHRRLQELIPARRDLLIESAYSKDTHAVCSRCVGVSEFPLADAGRVLDLLGYC